MIEAKAGDTVTVHYTGKLNDGTVFDSSIDRTPLQFTIGTGQVIPGFEEAVVGMSPGASRTIHIPAEQAYGPYRQDMVQEVDRDRLPADLEPQIGQQVQAQVQGGRSIRLTITDVSDTSVVLDANHPLAGKDLVFDIQLLDVS